MQPKDFVINFNNAPTKLEVSDQLLSDDHLVQLVEEFHFEPPISPKQGWRCEKRPKRESRFFSQPKTKRNHNTLLDTKLTQLCHTIRQEGHGTLNMFRTASVL